MHLELPIGSNHWNVEVREPDFVTRPGPTAAPLNDAEAAVYRAMDHPIKFEPLRRAMTPDDKIALVVDERLPDLAKLIQGTLKYLASAGIPPEAVTVISPAGSAQDWVDHLGDEFADLQAEIHQPDDRKKLSYLATSENGRRLYMNRTLVDADQVIVLSARREHPLLGITGAEGLVYPALSDDDNQKASRGAVSAAALQGEYVGDKTATEVIWLLGLPLFIHVFEGPGECLLEVSAGLPNSMVECGQRVESLWRSEIPERADTVIATLSGDPLKHTFEDLARAAMAGARVAKPGGRVVILSDADPELGPGFLLLRESDHSVDAIKRLTKEKPADMQAALGWAMAASRAKLFLASEIRPDTVSQVFATPLPGPKELQALLDQPGKIVHLPDAQLNWVTIPKTEESQS
ncbi:lactate racemase domain-containing protein [Zavarzinella formosa]|uniref:lactate racemase domain-containing protein n=1 Tax=Zavarzinella formosa TaxID=360055 RepID=UPI000314099A|nr:lactate racemase domain-containing protein [Zavarzinella formosa]